MPVTPWLEGIKTTQHDHPNAAHEDPLQCSLGAANLETPLQDPVSALLIFNAEGSGSRCKAWERHGSISQCMLTNS